MKRAIAFVTAALFFIATLFGPPAQGYTFDSTIPQSGGCPQPNHWNLSLATPLDRQWSTSLPALFTPVILTVAAPGTPAQLDEIEQTISDSFSVWSGSHRNIVQRDLLSRPRISHRPRQRREFLH